MLTLKAIRKTSQELETSVAGIKPLLIKILNLAPFSSLLIAEIENWFHILKVGVEDVTRASVTQCKLLSFTKNTCFSAWDSMVFGTSCLPTYVRAGAHATA